MTAGVFRKVFQPSLKQFKLQNLRFESAQSGLINTDEIINPLNLHGHGDLVRAEMIEDFVSRICSQSRAGGTTTGPDLYCVCSKEDDEDDDDQHDHPDYYHHFNVFPPVFPGDPRGRSLERVGRRLQVIGLADQVVQSVAPLQHFADVVRQDHFHLVHLTLHLVEFRRRAGGRRRLRARGSHQL